MVLPEVPALSVEEARCDLGAAHFRIWAASNYPMGSNPYCPVGPTHRPEPHRCLQPEMIGWVFPLDQECTLQLYPKARKQELFVHYCTQLL